MKGLTETVDVDRKSFVRNILGQTRLSKCVTRIMSSVPSDYSRMVILSMNLKETDVELKRQSLPRK